MMVQYLPNVQLFFQELIIKLFEKEYFGFEENAIDYVQKFVNFIDQNIDLLPSKKSPKSLKNKGSFYIFYKPNNRTTWYIFFDKKDSRYLIKHITNNHVFDSSILNNDA